jgi:hypothetical protein
MSRLKINREESPSETWAPPPLFGPGTLAASLAAEDEGLGRVEFSGGVPVWVAQATPRFPIVDEVAP